MPVQHSILLGLASSTLQNRVDPVDLALAAFFSGDVLISLVLDVQIGFRRVSGVLLGTTRRLCLVGLLTSRCVQTAVNLNLALHSLEDSMARALLWSILGTHRLGRLNSAMRASSILLHADGLVPTL